jgi:hypothetical protein
MVSLFAALHAQEPRATMVAARRRLAASLGASDRGAPALAGAEDTGGSSYPSEDSIAHAASRLASQDTPDLVGSWLAAALLTDEIGATTIATPAGENVWSLRLRFTSLPDAADWRREISLAELRAGGDDPLARLRGEAAAWFRARARP